MAGAFDLVWLAGRAEALRWRLMAKRAALRAALLAAGGVFMVAAIVMMHALALAALGPPLGTLGSLSAILAFDLVVGLVLAIVALRLGPGAGEREAGLVRALATGEIRRKTQTVRLAGQALGLLRRIRP